MPSCCWTGRAGPYGGRCATCCSPSTSAAAATTPSTPGIATPPADAVRLAGLTLPGLANAHSHAFHRALRGRTHGGRGDFWTWRDQMYAVADRLDPDSYLALARAVYAEMALAGITCVGEFHYLHHGPGGARYDDPNAMGAALVDGGRATPGSGITAAGHLLPDRPDSWTARR